MSINPAQGIGPQQLEPLSGATGRTAADSPPSEHAEPAQPVPGARPKQEVESPASKSLDDEMPQDEVQVQHEDGTAGKIIIKYMDHSGNLILQIPSAQILDLARTIDRDIQQAENARDTSAGEANNGERNSHGH